MPFIIKVADLYVKRTSRFGNFHGNLVFTANRAEARVWTRQKDAENATRAVEWRCCNYEWDRNKINFTWPPIKDNWDDTMISRLSLIRHLICVEAE